MDAETPEEQSRLVFGAGLDRRSADYREAPAAFELLLQLPAERGKRGKRQILGSDVEQPSARAMELVPIRCQFGNDLALEFIDPRGIRLKRGLARRPSCVRVREGTQ
jgi:hypothetical protein